MNRPGRAGLELANSICIASVVFPAPGLPATRLNESAGTPPPSTWLSPGTPVSRSFSAPGPWIASFRGSSLVAITTSLRLGAHDSARVRHAGLIHQSHCHLGSDDPAEQVDQFDHQCHEAG